MIHQRWASGVLDKKLGRCPPLPGGRAISFSEHRSLPVSWLKAVWKGRRMHSVTWWITRPGFGDFMRTFRTSSRVWRALRIARVYPHTSSTRRLPEEAIGSAFSGHPTGNVYWLPGSGNPADGSTKTKSDMAPLPRPSESGAYTPGALRPLKGVASCGN